MLPVFTSLAPKLGARYIDGDELGGSYQQHCIDTWRRQGCSVISVNTAEEAATIKRTYHGIEVVETAQSAQAALGRPLIYLSDILRLAVTRGHRRIAIANSDIFIRTDAPIIAGIADFPNDGCIYAKRAEVASIGHLGSSLYQFGFDVFCFDPQLIDAAKIEGFALGAPWWDYWFLLEWALNGKPLYSIVDPVFGHLTHDQHWSRRSWEVLFTRVLRTIAQRLREQQEGRQGASPPADAFMLRFFEFIERYLDLQGNYGYGAETFAHAFGSMFGLFAVEFINSQSTPLAFLSPDAGAGESGDEDWAVVSAVARTPIWREATAQ